MSRFPAVTGKQLIKLLSAGMIGNGVKIFSPAMNLTYFTVPHSIFLLGKVPDRGHLENDGSLIFQGNLWLICGKNMRSLSQYTN